MYPNSIRWPVPKQCGKDLGDLAGTPLTVEQWFLAGLPDHVKKKISITAAVREDGKNEKPQQLAQPEVQQKQTAGVLQPLQQQIVQDNPRRKIVKPLPPPHRINSKAYDKLHKHAHRWGAKLTIQSGRVDLEWQGTEDELIVDWGNKLLENQPALQDKLKKYMEAA